jgi:hypothetical protein
VTSRRVIVEFERTIGFKTSGKVNSSKRETRNRQPPVGRSTNAVRCEHEEIRKQRERVKEPGA